MNDPKLWLIGAGTMAIEYAKVLNSLGVDYLVIGRSETSALNFERATGKKVVTGGLDHYASLEKHIPQYAIVAVGVEQLKNTLEILVKIGVKNILAEKPGGINFTEIQYINEFSSKEKSNILLAYNRRFYESVNQAKRQIVSDGGLLSFNFEFTEWSHVIAPLVKAPGVKEHWFLANSTHVVDMAFYLGGYPKEISCFNEGKLSWHPTASIFAGAGKTVNNALFTYQANWEAPGRWAVEFLTSKHRLILRPLEKLFIQKIGSIAIEEYLLNDSLDKNYKPGLYLQTTSFLNNELDNFCTLSNQVALLSFYKKMCNYQD